VIGGLGSLPGALLGGLLVGIVFVLAGAYFLLRRKRPTQERFRKWKRKDQSEELGRRDLQR